MFWNTDGKNVSKEFPEQIPTIETIAYGIKKINTDIKYDIKRKNIFNDTLENNENLKDKSFNNIGRDK